MLDEITTKAAVWLQSVLHRVPATIKVIYVEYGDAVSPDQEDIVYFNAFGFESLADDRFDPANPEHVGGLGDFTWEPPDECKYRADDHPKTDWLAVLRAAAGLPEVMTLASLRGIKFIVGEHDCEVFVIV